MGTWQDAIQSDRAEISPSTDRGCRIHGQGVASRSQRRPEHRHGDCRIYKEGPYNGFSVSSQADRSSGCSNVCAVDGANSTTVPTAGNNASSGEAGATGVTARDAAATLFSTDESVTDNSAACGTATTGCDRPVSKRGWFSHLSSGSVPRLVRRRSRSALLHLRRNGFFRGRRDVLPIAIGRARFAGLQGTADAHVRGGTLPRRVDGVSTRRNGERLDVGRVSRLHQPETQGSARALSDDRHDRPARIVEVGARACHARRATLPPLTRLRREAPSTQAVLHGSGRRRLCSRCQTPSSDTRGC